MTPTIQEIKEVVAARWGVTVLDIVSQRRDKDIVRPRHVAMWLARHLTGHSLPEIGRGFREPNRPARDHTTVMHAIRRIDEARRRDLRLNRTLLELADQLGGEVPSLVQPRLELVA